MKNLALTSILFLLFGCVVSSQPIPPDSMYFGQTPPGNIPQIFNLSVNTGSFAAERIAISNDGKEIYYSEVHSYYPITGDTIKYYKYNGSNWTGPFNLFEGYCAAALSVTGDTMYIQNSNVETFFSVKNGSSWSTPQRILANLNLAHYLQVTNNGNYYVSSISNPTVGGNDWCKLFLNGTDTSAVSIWKPANSTGDNLDFFVSRDETYMIIAKSGLQISYHKNNGSWTNPKNLGSTINFGLGMWGPYVSSDNKYLFYTTGTHADYSDTYVYWVRIDSLIDSLMHTNFIPYLNNSIPNQHDTVGQFFNYSIPDSTFIDDDSNNTLAYSAKLYNGTPLPTWLTFDSITRTFSGTPTIIQTLNIKVTVTDTAGATVFTTFKIYVHAPSAINQITEQNKGFKIFPNPSNGQINISSSELSGKIVILEISNLEGKVILKDTFVNDISIDFASKPKGIYVIKLFIDKEVITSNICLE